MTLTDGATTSLDTDSGADSLGDDAAFWIASGDFELADDFVGVQAPTEEDSRMAMIQLQTDEEGSGVEAGMTFFADRYPWAAVVVRVGPTDFVENEDPRGQIKVVSLSEDRICVHVDYESSGFSLEGVVETEVRPPPP